MTKYKLLALALIGALLVYLQCSNTSPAEVKILEGTYPTKAFATHWYDGKAEVSTYSLEQIRYGEIHQGHAALIFVTEDFSAQKQVKLDDPSRAPNDKVSVLKLNFAKKFLTGIYPYSILNSIFTPVDLSGTLKTSCTVQEWCGHTYTQLNRSKSGFKAVEFSYFESEGDKESKLENVLLEDELWNMIRIDPSAIPTGKVKLIRGSMAVRLQHQPLQAVEANISLSKNENSLKPTQTLLIEYPDRKLEIQIEEAFPYKIMGWQESYSEFNGKVLTTKASLIQSLRIPYWQLHNNEHLGWRDSIGLRSMDGR